MVLPEDDRRRRPPVLRPRRAAVLIAAGIVVGIALVSKSHTLELTSSTTTSSTTPSAASSSSTTTNGQGSTTTSTSTPAAAKPARQVKVVVANGTTVSGAATRIGTELSTEGYTNETPVDTTSPQTASATYYAPGFESNAAAIATFLQLKKSPLPMPGSLPVASTAGADVLVIIGPDLASSTTSTSSAH